MFLEQMVALVRDSRDGEVVIPPTIQALLAARLDQLDPSERGVLEVGAIEGRLFHRGAVQALVPTEPQVTTRLTALVRKELVRPDKPQIVGDDAFRFRHLLIRDAAYDGLPKSTRAELHEQFADWLEEHGRELVELDEILGYHLEQAASYRTELGMPNERLAMRASERLVAAARRALARFDGAAVGLFERAVDLRPGDGYDVNLELDLADALFMGGRPKEAEALAADLAERAAAHGDRCGELRAGLNEGVTRLYVDPEANLDELMALAEQARPVLEASGDPLGMHDVWFALATVEHGRMQSLAKLAAAEKAFECARLAGDERRTTRMIPFLVNSRFFGPTPVADTLRWIDEHAATLEHPALTAHRAELLAMLGRFDEARSAHATHHARILERSPGAAPEAISCSMRSWVEWWAGDVEAAEQWNREACELLEKMGHSSWLSTMAGEHGRLLYALGRHSEAEEWAEKSRKLGADDDVATQNVWRRVRARVLASGGDVEQAEGLACEALALVAPTDALNLHAASLVDLAEVLECANRRPEATAALGEAVSLVEQKGNLVMVARVGDRLAALATG